MKIERRNELIEWRNRERKREIFTQRRLKELKQQQREARTARVHEVSRFKERAGGPMLRAANAN